MIEGSDVDPVTDTEERMYDDERILIAGHYGMPPETPWPRIVRHIEGNRDFTHQMDATAIESLEASLTTARDRERELREALERIKRNGVDNGEGWLVSYVTWEGLP